MLRPEQVRLGREKKDLCIRLKDDIEKAHRDTDRRFKTHHGSPVDYFYRWMVKSSPMAMRMPSATTRTPRRTPSLIARERRGFSGSAENSVLFCTSMPRSLIALILAPSFIARRSCRRVRAIIPGKSAKRKSPRLRHAKPAASQRPPRPMSRRIRRRMKRHKENFGIWRGRCATAFPGRTRAVGVRGEKHDQRLGRARRAGARYEDNSKNRNPQSLGWLLKAQNDTLLREYALYWTAQAQRALGRYADA